MPCSIALFPFLLVAEVPSCIFPVLLTDLSHVCDLYIGVGLQQRLPAVRRISQGIPKGVTPQPDVTLLLHQRAGGPDGLWQAVVDTELAGGPAAIHTWSAYWPQQPPGELENPQLSLAETA